MPQPGIKNIALVAHDMKKPEILAWATRHREELASYTLYATGSTGKMIADDLGLVVNCLLSGPLGGDQQIGGMIAEGKIDMLVFFWDPMHAQPHDPDVKALLRMGVLWDIPMASNTKSADCIMHWLKAMDN